MSDTNNSWSESISLDEINQMVDAELTEVEWLNLKDDLDNAVADIINRVMGNYDVY